MTHTPKHNPGPVALGTWYSEVKLDSSTLVRPPVRRVNHRRERSLSETEVDPGIMMHNPTAVGMTQTKQSQSR